MRPIPTGASAAMLFSLAVAFIVSPWAAYRIFRAPRGARHSGERPRGAGRRALYRRAMSALVTRPRRALARSSPACSALLPGVGRPRRPGRWCKVKMLPFDNKSEFQVLVDHDEGTPLEVTLETARPHEPVTWPRVPEVRTSRSTPATPRPSTSTASCATTSCAARRTRRRPAGEPRRPSTSATCRATTSPSACGPPSPEIAQERGARREGGRDPARAARARHAGGGDLRPDAAGARALAAQRCAASSRRHRGRRRRRRLAGGARGARRARERRPREGGRCRASAAAASWRRSPGRAPGATSPASTRPPRASRCRCALRLSAADRASLERRLSLRVDSPGGRTALVGELARVERGPGAAAHRAQGPEARGLRVRRPGRASARARSTRSPRLEREDRRARAARRGARVERYAIEAPATSRSAAMKWDGEWQITYEVFRDLGHRLRGGAGPDRDPGDRLVPVLRGARSPSCCPSRCRSSASCPGTACSAPSSPPPP